MNETKQTPTPGPWRLCGRFNPTVEKADETNRICEMLDHAPEDYANARLIAAAPELLEALQEIAKHTDPDDETSYRADDREGCLNTVHALSKAAIAKAKGGAA